MTGTINVIESETGSNVIQRNDKSVPASEVKHGTEDNNIMITTEIYASPDSDGTHTSDCHLKQEPNLDSETAIECAAVVKDSSGYENKDSDTNCDPSKPRKKTVSMIAPTTATVTATATGRVKSQTTKLVKETKHYLGAKSRTTGYRAACYKPSLETFQSVSFADYVRGVCLGVPIPGLVPDEPIFGDSDDDDDTSDSSSDCEDAKDNLNDNSSHQLNSKSDTSPFVPTVDDTPIPVTPIHDHDNSNNTLTKTNENNIKSEQPTRMTTRFQSRSKSTPTLIKEDQSSSVSLRNKRNTPNLDNPTYKLPDSLKLSDGIAKITPPEGWWSKRGIANDSTARGPRWQKNHPLGDMIIPSPIKQCLSGIGGVYEFTMMELPPISVADFRTKADIYRKRQLGKEVEEDESDACMDELARKFWKRLGPTMESSLYGADMEGTLFEGDHACGWNVDQLESCLQLLRADFTKPGNEELNESEHFKLPGVTSAYLYYGMWASVFAAHTEDMNLLSINYLHAGAPKYWYAIAAEDADRFESLMASQFSTSSSQCPQFLRHKRCLLSPNILNKAGISYTTQVQRAGDIIITFPGSYHFGFNTGFNCAESTNFAVPEWIPMGDMAKVCLCHPHSVRIDMNRFKSLLASYDSDMSVRRPYKPLSYSEWSKLQVKKQKRALYDQMKKNSIKSKISNSKEFKSESLPKSTTRPKSFVVEIMSVLPFRKAIDINNHPPQKKKKQRKNASKSEDDF